MTTTKETAAYVAASLTAQLKLDTMLEISKAWAQFYDTALEKMGFEPGYDTVPAQKPAGGRDIPIRREVGRSGCDYGQDCHRWTDYPRSFW